MKTNLCLLLITLLILTFALNIECQGRRRGTRRGRPRKKVSREDVTKSSQDESNEPFSDSDETKTTTTRRSTWTPRKPDVYRTMPGFDPNFTPTPRKYIDPIARYYYNDLPRIGNSKENYRNRFFEVINCNSGK